MWSDVFDVIFPLMLVLGVALLVGLIFGASVVSEWRARQLAKEDPPAAEDLAEVEEMGKLGGFHLAGRRPSAARHFAQEIPTARYCADGGSHRVPREAPRAMVKKWSSD